MTKMFKKFLHTEDGAAVVDMTMLMAALVGLALAVTASVSNGMEGLSGDLSTTMIDHDVNAAF
jgi:Flp pilus assembly pilin Flp